MSKLIMPEPSNGLSQVLQSFINECNILNALFNDGVGDKKEEGSLSNTAPLCICIYMTNSKLILNQTGS